MQERTLERVGGTKSVTVDVRIISATNKNLEAEMRKGHFREDLYYRTHVFPIYLPPLRERKEDIPTLVAFFIRKFHDKMRHGVLGVSSKAMDELLRYHWPGNVRELENVIERAILNANRGMIKPEHLPLTITTVRRVDTDMTSALDLRTALRRSTDILPLHEIEREVLLQALKLTNYNMSTTASALGIGRTTLYRKVHKYGIPVPRLNWNGAQA